LARWNGDRLRWHPQCPWRGGRAGCLVAPINDHATGLVVGIWRILPTLLGEVQCRGLGPTRANAARLFRAEGPQVVIAEGVEDAIAAHELTGLPAWAALSAGNMTELVLPHRLREVLILADRDESGLGLAKAHALAARLRQEGRQAVVRRPTTGKDANDVPRARRAI
jgi:putative DNA primase/helicase